MPRPQAPSTDPITLFYPVDSEGLSPAAGKILPFLIVPFVLVFAFLFAPALLLWIPLVFINHWVNGTPLEFNPTKYCEHLESSKENQS